MTHTSVTLLQRLTDRPNPADWGRFVGLYTPLLLAWGRRAGLPPDDAADLAQDVLTVLVRRLPAYERRPGHPFRAWLRTVALNKLRERARRPAPGVVADPDALAAVAAPDEDPFWEGEYRAHVARRALAFVEGEFSPSVRKAFWETVVAGRPSPEVAVELGMTPGGVRSAKLRVLSRLRAELGDLLD